MKEMGYPRPQLVRENWRLLNGYWDYAISIDNKITSYDGKILVPFSPECAASGVKRTLLPGNYLHYRTYFSIKKPTGKRVWLHFEAVDEYAMVYLNDHYLGDHHGGYLPFAFDITPYLADGQNELKVIVQDDSDLGEHARGKQKLNPAGMYYQAQSGIWQSVWLEITEPLFTSDARFTPRLSARQLEVLISANDAKAHECVLTIRDGERVISTHSLTTGHKQRLTLKEAHAWDVDDPFLYDVDITMGADHVQSYFGLRDIATTFINSHQVITLNGKPVFHFGVLDQGYLPETLMTYPNDEAMLKDLKLVKQMGFNAIRKHVKIEPSRWYYLCDRLGLLVMQDVVNSGRGYNEQLVTYLPNIFPYVQTHTDDTDYQLMRRENEKNREEYYQQLKEMVDHLHHFVCIDAYVAFNEGWGQFDSRKVTAYLRSLDETRLIDSASGWFDVGAGDFKSIHNYFHHLHVSPSERIILLSEFGGKSLAIDGHSFAKKEYGYGRLPDRKELTKAYLEVIERDVIKNISKGLAGCIYTQLSDIADEINGLITYDRAIIKIDPEIARAIASRVYHCFNSICHHQTPH